MQETKTKRLGRQRVEKLKNGLTIDKVNKAKEILRQVNVAKISSMKGVKVSTIQNVLRDKSPRVDLLSIILKEAKKEVGKKRKVLEALPL